MVRKVWKVYRPGRLSRGHGYRNRTTKRVTPNKIRPFRLNLNEFDFRSGARTEFLSTPCSSKITIYPNRLPNFYITLPYENGFPKKFTTSFYISFESGPGYFCCGTFGSRISTRFRAFLNYKLMEAQRNSYVRRGLNARSDLSGLTYTHTRGRAYSADSDAV